MRLDVRLVASVVLLGIGNMPARSARAQATNEADGLLLARTAQDSADTSRTGFKSAKSDERIDVSFHDVPLKAALRKVSQDAGVAIFYNDRDVPAEKMVSARLSGVSVMDALRVLLHGLDLRVRTAPAGFIIEPVKAIRSEAPADTTGVITGAVVDSASGSPVAGAAVTIIGTTLGGRTGVDGTFEFHGVAPGKHTIEVRVLGYRRRTISVTVGVGDTLVTRVILVPVPRMLDQVVTTATGDHRRVEVGNVIDVVNADSLVRAAPVNTLSEVLASRVPGLQVYFTGGMSGASPQISVRGQNSLSLSNQPLLYIDGIRVGNSAAQNATAPVAVGGSSGRFDDLVPSEIESIEVVKGPSAATLYGTDAANGVILVRTKRGEPGPPRWNFFAEGGVLRTDRNRFRTNYYPWGHTTSGAPSNVRCPLRSVASGSCVQDSITSFSPLLDPETTPMGQGSRYSFGAQVRGGSDVSYFLSGTVEREIGYLKMPDADRTLLEAQTGHELNDEALKPNALRKYAGRLNVTIPLASSADVTVAVGLNSLRLRIPTPLALSNADGYGSRELNDGWRPSSRPGDVFLKRNRQSVTHLTTSIQGKWRPEDWLSANLTAGLDYSSAYYDRLDRAGEGFLPASVLGARENTKVTTSLQTLNASTAVDLPITHRLTSRTTIGVQFNRRLELSNTAAAEQLTTGAGTVAGGALLLPREATTETVVAGAYAEQTLALNQRLYLTLAARADGGSAFGRNFHTALYPKASMSWVLSDEKFWPSVPRITSLRLRAAYGESGVQPGPVDALSSESLFPAFVGGALTTGAGLGNAGNPDLRPERQRELEAGIDLEALDGRVHVAVTRYDKRSHDALVNLPLPALIGGGTRWENVGAVRNWGYEFELAIAMLERPGLRWRVSLNGSLNNNEVLSIAPGIDALYSSNYTSIVRGYPLFSYFDFPITGFDDANGDGILAENEITVGSEREFAGRGYPRVQLGATTEIGLFQDRLRVSASVERRSDYRLLDHDWIKCSLDACAGVSFPDASFQAQAAAQARRAASLHNTSWGFFRDASFTRLRELAITYSLPGAAARKLGVRTASVSVAGRNLALWSRYPGPDPEVQSILGGNNHSAGFDRTAPPAPAYWLFTLHVSP